MIFSSAPKGKTYLTHFRRSVQFFTGPHSKMGSGLRYESLGKREIEREAEIDACWKQEQVKLGGYPQPASEPAKLPTLLRGLRPYLPITVALGGEGG
jgi:hypothetical protein